MGLDAPELDDRRYEEILEDAIERLPVHAPEWTDHNAHDPGITVLEMLAWLAETYIYQLSRVTDDHRRKYLALMGVEPRPPKPATVYLQFESDDPGSDPITEAREGEIIEEGEMLSVDDGAGFTGVFETTKPVTVTSTRIERVVTTTSEGWTDNSTANETAGMRYLAFGDRAEAGDALYLGFDRDPFAVESEEPSDGETTTDEEESTDDKKDIIDVTVDYDDASLPPVTTHTGEEASFRPSVELAWEHCTDYDAWRADDAWEPLTVVRDQTNRLYGGGTVALEKTDEWLTDPGVILGDDEAHFWIRCRVETAGYEIPPPLDGVRMDLVPARHRAMVEGEELERPGGGTGTTAGPNQSFTFSHSPVLDATVTVGDEPWEQVSDFDASGPDDRHYVVESSRDAVRFGNGNAGMIPEPGQSVYAESYAYGGGQRGNVPKSSSCEFVDSKYGSIPVSLREDASGGADAETLDAAIARLRRALDTPRRAVSLADYRQLAKQTPGVRIARVAAFPASRTNATGRTEHDGVRVVVVPHSPRPEPQPSEGMLVAVRRHLERHRLLAERFRVAPPRFVGVGVDTTVRIGPGYDESGRIAAIEAALDAFLDPLGEADDDGWPFGRPVYSSELYGVIEAVDGVDGALDVSISTAQSADRDGNGNVLLGDVGLPSPTHHHVFVERSPAGRER